MARIATTTVFLNVLAMFVVHAFSVDTLNIFLLGGQSNMAGRGSLADPGAELVPGPSVFRFSGNDTWVEAADPLHCDVDPGKYCGVGPGMSFAKTLQKTDLAAFGLIGLVPCAMGDTSITEWSKDSFLYNRMLARANGAVKAGGGLIRGLLWYQGEKDSSGRPEDALMYKARFQKFLTDFRSDLGMPLLPVIEVALDFENNGTYLIDLVRKAQNETASELQGVRCVDAKGLEISQFDHVHLTTASQVKLGAMMTQAFLTFH